MEKFVVNTIMRKVLPMLIASAAGAAGAYVATKFPDVHALFCTV